MEKLSPLADFIDSVPGTYNIPGCDCAVAVDGNIVFRRAAGFSDRERRVPVNGRETYWIYSATKLFTCAAALQLMERGALELDAPVSRWLPEFGELTVKSPDGPVRAKNTMTVRDLFTMTGGLDYALDMRPELQKALRGRDLSTRAIVASLSRDPLNFEPGTRFLYSMCHDVLGSVIEAASGERLSVFIEKNILEPLGLKETTFHPSDALLSRAAYQWRHTDAEGTIEDMAQNNHYLFSPEYDSGGAGLMSTVDDYIRFASELSLGGGVILKPESVALMSTPMLGKVQRKDFQDRSPAMLEYTYGLGVRVRVETEAPWSVAGEFGWDGAAGAYAYIDTKNRVAMYYAQQVCNSNITYQKLHPKLREKLCESLVKAGLQK